MTKEARHSLIFLTYNHPDLIDARLGEVEAYMGQRTDTEIIVFDNGSEDYGVRLALASHRRDSTLPLTIQRRGSNIGFGPGFNAAVREASGDILHLLSSDAAFHGDLIAMLEYFPPSQVICHRRIDFPAGWNQFGKILIHYPDGYYIALHAETWQALGGFDPRFAPHDYEDVDLGYRIAKTEGLELIERADLPISHQAASTIGYTAERRDHTVIMRAAFAEKWGLENVPENP